MDPLPRILYFLKTLPAFNNNIKMTVNIQKHFFSHLTKLYGKFSCIIIHIFSKEINQFYFKTWTNNKDIS